MLIANVHLKNRNSEFLRCTAKLRDAFETVETARRGDVAANAQLNHSVPEVATSRPVDQVCDPARTLQYSRILHVGKSSANSETCKSEITIKVRRKVK